MSFRLKNEQEGESDQEDADYNEMYLDDKQKEFLKHTKCVFRGHSRLKLKWDLVVMIFAIFNCFTIPLQVAFEPKAMETLGFEILNWFIDLLFMLDLISNFRTTFIHPKTGKEVLDLKEITLCYLKGRFWIDLLAILPFDIVGDVFIGHGNTTILKSIALLKLVRILRLNKIISIMKVGNEVKLSLKLFKLIFFLVMYLHCVACIWYFIVIGDKKWLPPLDYVYVTTHFYEESLGFRYCSSLYHSIMMLVGNDDGPRGIVQLLF